MTAILFNDNLPNSINQNVLLLLGINIIITIIITMIIVAWWTAGSHIHLPVQRLCV